MICPPIKPEDVYDSKKIKVPIIERETKIPILAVIYGLINFLI
jgi:hypothetical protein